MRYSIQWMGSVFAILMLGIPWLADAATFNVSNGAQLQSALDTAQSNGQADTIILAPGNYDASGATFIYPSNPGAAIGENFPVTIQGNDPTNTILDGGNAKQIMNINTQLLSADDQADFVIQGVTFQKGNDQSGGGGGGLIIFTNDADITVNNSQFLNNTSSLFGAGASFESNANGNINVSGNLFVGNISSGGAGGAGAIIQAGTGVFSNNIFFNNQATGPGGGLNFEYLGTPPTGGPFTLVNNTFVGNTTAGGFGRGGGVYLDIEENGEVLNVYNNIIFGNTASTLGNDALVDDNAPGIINLFNNDFSNFCFSAGSTCNPTVFPGLTQSGNLNVDPLLIAPASGNFNLGVGSKAIDSGDGSAPNLPATDFAGNPRIFGPAPDMGALEAVPNIQASPNSIDFGTLKPLSNSQMILTLTNSGSVPLVISGIALSDDNNFAIDPSLGNTPCGNLSPSLQPQANCTLGVIFQTGSLGTFNATLSVNSNDPDEPQLAVPVTGTTSNSGGGGCALSGSEGSFSACYFGLFALGSAFYYILRRKN